jgi:hypothetical protein
MKATVGQIRHWVHIDKKPWMWLGAALAFTVLWELAKRGVTQAVVKRMQEGEQE